MKKNLLNPLIVTWLCFLALGCVITAPYEQLAADKKASEGDYEEAFDRHFALASRGEPGSMSYIAEAFKNGKGVEKDLRSTKYWLLEQAKSKDLYWKNEALYELGYFYYEQYEIDGDPESYEKAAEYWLSCSEVEVPGCNDMLELIQEHPAVYVRMNRSLFFADGSSGYAPGSVEYADSLYLGGKVDEAIAIYDWHAKRGNSKAQLLLAQYYAREDDPRRIGWGYLAARNGEPVAQHDLGLSYYRGGLFVGSDKEAVSWLARASSQGNVAATNDVGVVYANPIDPSMEPDYEQALNYFYKARDLGSVDALVNIGDLHYLGRGVPKDEGLAKRYYLKAAEMGHINAQRLLKQRYGQDVVLGDESLPVTQGVKAVEAIAPARQQSLVELFSKLSPYVLELVSISQSADGELNPVATGSGVVLFDNVAITNEHVVSTGIAAASRREGEQPAVWVTLSENKDKDLAIIGSETTNGLPPLRLVPSSKLKIGQSVFAIGSPRGLTNTLSQGIISGIRKESGRTLIQTTAAIAPGSSGGGLFDMDGNLVGITTQQAKGSGNLNFAVSAEDVGYMLMDVLNKLNP